MKQDIEQAIQLMEVAKDCIYSAGKVVKRETVAFADLSHAALAVIAALRELKDMREKGEK